MSTYKVVTKYVSTYLVSYQRILYNFPFENATTADPLLKWKNLQAGTIQLMFHFFYSRQ